MSVVTDFRRSSAATLLGTAADSTSWGGVAISSNGIATAGWVPVATGSNSAVWRDAISFGSNTNDVGPAGTMGASASNSRADHVHRGVTSIAHTSNTFYGPITLTTAGSLIGITSPSAGTFTFTGSASLTAHTHAGAASGGGTLAPTGMQILASASTVTGTRHDEVPPNRMLIWWNGASEARFTGFQGGAEGVVLGIINASATIPLTLVHAAGSAADNRILCPSDIDAVIGPRSTAWMIYDTTALKWRVMEAAPVVGQGAAFPTSPVTDQRFHRTDLGPYYWDGTRWLSVEVFSIPINPAAVGVTASGSASGTVLANVDVYVLSFDVVSLVLTTNDATHYWQFRAFKLSTANAATQLGSTVDTKTDGLTTWVMHSIAVNAVVTTGFPQVYFDWVKQNTPGAAYAGCTVHFRRIAT